MSERTAEIDALRRGVEEIIADRYAGDFTPILPRLRALLDATAPRVIPSREPHQ